MENIVECNICMEKYDKKEKIPRILSCGHTFCTSCLQKIKEKNSSEKQIKCPLDLKIGFDNNKIEEIPINRVVVDLIELNIDENLNNEKNNQKDIFLEVKEELQSLFKIYDFSQKEISDSLSYLLLSKEKCENSIINYYDTLITKLINRKEYMLNILYNYINEKNSFYNLLLEKLRNLTNISQQKLTKIDTAIKYQEKNKISNSDKINFISTLGMDTLEDNDFIKQLNNVLNEIKSGFIPTVLYDKNENIEGFAEAVINYLTLNIENINNYSAFDNTINSKLKNLNNFRNDDNNSDQNIYNIDNIINDDSNFNLLKNENDNDNDDNNKKEKVKKKLNKFFNNKIQELNNTFAKLNLNEQITKLLWFNQGGKSIFSFDLIGNESWQEINNINNFIIPISPSFIQLSNESAFISGGYLNIKQVSKNCFLYNKGIFKEKENMIKERRNHASLRIDNYIYVCGGMDNNSNHMNSCEKYSLQYEKWIKCSNLNIERSHLSLCNMNNKYIYALGGENKTTGFLDTIEKYSIIGDSWELIKVKLPYKLECVGCIGISHQEIIIFGGYCPQKIKRESIIKYNIANHQIDFSSKQLNMLGWSIYMPIKIGNYIYVILGGDENEKPIIEKFQLM